MSTWCGEGTVDGREVSLFRGDASSSGWETRAHSGFLAFRRVGAGGSKRVLDSVRYCEQIVGMKSGRSGCETGQRSV